MFLHLGGNTFISCKFLIGIIAIPKKEQCRIGQTGDKGKDHAWIGQGPFRTIIITKEHMEYYSPIGAKTLMRRVSQGQWDFLNTTEARNGKKGCKNGKES